MSAQHAAPRDNDIFAVKINQEWKINNYDGSYLIQEIEKDIGTVKLAVYSDDGLYCYGSFDYLKDASPLEHSRYLLDKSWVYIGQMMKCDDCLKFCRQRCKK